MNINLLIHTANTLKSDSQLFQTFSLSRFLDLLIVYNLGPTASFLSVVVCGRKVWFGGIPKTGDKSL